MQGKALVVGKALLYELRGKQFMAWIKVENPLAVDLSEVTAIV